MTIGELPPPRGHDGSYRERFCDVLARGCPLASLEDVLDLGIRNGVDGSDRWDLEVGGP